MHSSQVAPHITKGTIAAAECCFGAELFDPSLAAAGGDPMSMVYLLGGAAAYVGSTNKAYGPFNANGQADLLVQYFIDIALKGASMGRAMLQARQRFVNSQKMAETLAQFVLFGDPSVVPIDAQQKTSNASDVDATGEVTMAKDILSGLATPSDARSGRKSRRVSLKSEGVVVASAATYIGG
jgi:peptidase C25-like protein